MFFVTRSVFTFVANIHYLMEAKKTLIIFTHKSNSCAYVLNSLNKYREKNLLQILAAQVKSGLRLLALSAEILRNSGDWNPPQMYSLKTVNVKQYF